MDTEKLAELAETYRAALEDETAARTQYGEAEDAMARADERWNLANRREQEARYALVSYAGGNPE